MRLREVHGVADELDVAQVGMAQRLAGVVVCGHGDREAREAAAQLGQGGREEEEVAVATGAEDEDAAGGVVGHGVDACALVGQRLHALAVATGGEFIGPLVVEQVGAAGDHAGAFEGVAGGEEVHGGGSGGFEIADFRGR